MVIIMSILASTFIWTLAQNTGYNVAIREKNQLESDVQSEDIQVTSTTYVVNANNKVNVSTTINNIGSLSVQFTTLWAYANNATYTGYNFTALSNVNVRGGATTPLSVNVTVQGLSLTGTYSFASWLITGRGNVVSLQKVTSSLTNIVTSNTTQGIGSLMMNFQNFTYYNVSQSSPYGLIGYPTGASGYYVQGAKGPPKGQFAFRVVITNLDQSQMDITLAAGSVLFSIFPTPTSAFQGTAWYVVNVNGTGAISNSYTPVTLVYNVATPVYFASSVSGTYTPFSQATFTGTCPVNLALTGAIGNITSSIPFGQNIPFVAIEVVN
ncbi:hypothetical protein MUP01_09195 [Candidatus Bathyarchaeota archaeon]|nr:hypothetical protein [Candidatus Bathyarchaeota archaeon]